MKKLIIIFFMIVFILASFFGCAPTQKMVKIPNYDNVWQIHTGEFPDPKDVSFALTVFYRYWYYYFDEVPLCLDSVMIEWRDNPRYGKGFSITGNKTRGLLKGVALSKGYVWVWKGDEGRISSTALIHELIHCAIWCRMGHGDPDHEGIKYRGWTFKHTEFLYRVNYLLENKGL